METSKVVTLDAVTRRGMSIVAAIVCHQAGAHGPVEECPSWPPSSPRAAERYSWTRRGIAACSRWNRGTKASTVGGASEVPGAWRTMAAVLRTIQKGGATTIQKGAGRKVIGLDSLHTWARTTKKTINKIHIGPTRKPKAHQQNTLHHFTQKITSLEIISSITKKNENITHNHIRLIYN